MCYPSSQSLDNAINPIFVNSNGKEGSSSSWLTAVKRASGSHTKETNEKVRNQRRKHDQQPGEHEQDLKEIAEGIDNDNDAIIFDFYEMKEIRAQIYVHGFSDNNPIDPHLLTKNIGCNHTILVDANGGGDFKSVQAAIDQVPDGNSEWIIIHIRKGTYREKVSIPRSKPFIFMRGEGRGKTSIVWSQSSLEEYESATFKAEAPHFVAFGISFKNTAPTLIAHTLSTKSVAALVAADKAAFYQCGFFGNHNTLFDSRGRHYYDNCYIQGSVDFIFGRGQAMFHDCELFVSKNGRVEIGGSITAHHRNSRRENSGFVFLKGKVYGTGDVYLGRPQGEHSRVLFANTYLSRTVIPHGWSNWSYSGDTHNLYQAEYKCHGPGSDSQNRAPWSKQLRDEEAAPFLTIDFIKGKEWLPAWF